ncbi:LysR family transcriptional regulator [Shewanella intestini]|uniref:LysR family transcriptional regulator n=1 Tax=Shewanella intestini TaxID=2017544 RepID=A0ABS5I377_9GAMM|nr:MULTISPECIES: LysR family transcriptional regulator [Shewanella]MBR9728476.1 LysR family transcriptional regulator [Shewanella intestini]MRG36295.1 LysR family transcriptional regulator [Shewanella sp. XMDDZSB0408]
MINNANLADIRAFVLIAQLGNLTKAAQALNVSRSHVSRQLSALEKYLGVTLVIRTTRSIKLTQAGEQLLEQSQQALSQIDQALLSTIDNNDNMRGHLSINCVGGPIGEDVISTIVNDFMLQHPHISIDLDFSSERIDLFNDDFDLAFRMGTLADAGFIGRKLLDIEMVTLASPEYLRLHSTPTEPKELVNHRCITGSVTHWHYQHCTQPQITQDVQVKGQLTCRNGRTLINGALKGNGIIRVPLMYCPHEVAKGELVTLLPQWQISSVPFYAIFHQDKYQPKRLRAFIDFCVNAFNSPLKSS